MSKQFKLTLKKQKSGRRPSTQIVDESTVNILEQKNMLKNYNVEVVEQVKIKTTPEELKLLKPKAEK